MKKKLTKETFSSLRDSYPVLTMDELIQIVGGSTCVIHCFAYILQKSWESYANDVVSAGYDIYSNGGVHHSEVVGVGAVGGLDVNEITNGTTFSFDNSTGKTSDGQKLMITYNNSGEDHAVLVTGISSNGTITYYDPSTQETNTLSANSYSAIYGIK
jgi:hypothetical protein